MRLYALQLHARPGTRWRVQSCQREAFGAPPVKTAAVRADAASDGFANTTAYSSHRGACTL